MAQRKTARSGLLVHGLEESGCKSFQVGAAHGGPSITRSTKSCRGPCMEVGTWEASKADRNSVWANRAMVHGLSLLEVEGAACEWLFSGTVQKVGIGS